MNYKILEKNEHKCLISQDVNYYFNKLNGLMMTWGKTKKDDPKFSPVGPFILDLELGTICSGINGIPCKHCYKSNTSSGKIMNFKTFKNIFHKFPKTLTQIAIGLGDIDSCADLWKIMEYCRNNDYNKVIPNITINGDRLTDEIVKKLSELCGAVAVSYYGNKDICYGAVKKLTDLGMKQINIHSMVSAQTEQNCYDVMNDGKTDTRLSKLNAIVFLRLKEKNRGKTYQQLPKDKYIKMIQFGLDNKIPIGFDSCSAEVFLCAIKNRKDFKQLEQICESCESSLFSSYVNVDGVYFPCSFAEDKHEGIDVTKCNDFLKDIWQHPKTIEFRNKLLCQKHEISETCRKCPIYNLE